MTHWKGALLHFSHQSLTVNPFFFSIVLCLNNPDLPNMFCWIGFLMRRFDMVVVGIGGRVSVLQVAYRTRKRGQSTSSLVLRIESESD